MADAIITAAMDSTGDTVYAYDSGGNVINITQEIVDLISGLKTDESISVDVAFILFCSILVFSMQLGFSLLEIGCVSMRNTNSLLYQNLMDASIAATTFYLLGYGFAYGTGSSFIGLSNFAFSGFDNNSYTYAFWVLQFAFAGTTSSIVAGAIAERCKITTYFVFGPLLTAFTYPVVVHWVWSTTGWASYHLDEESRLFGVGAIDFAGSTVVHSVGGITALVGCIILGPRRGRFTEDGAVVPMPQQSIAFQTAGTFVLWIGWYGFNVGSTGSIANEYAIIAAKVAANMTISAAFAGITCSIVTRLVHGSLDVPMVNNGILAGLVSITASCGIVTGYCAVIIGIIGGLLYFGSSKLLLKMKIDDVVDAVPVHLVCGIWGTLAVGFFAVPGDMDIAFGTGSCGLFYSSQCGGNGGYQLAAQICIILAVLAWAGGLATLVFLLLKAMNQLRAEKEGERIGLDRTYHGGYCYELMPPTPQPSELLSTYGSIESEGADIQDVENQKALSGLGGPVHYATEEDES